MTKRAYQIRCYEPKLDQEYSEEKDAREAAVKVIADGGTSCELIKWVISPNLPGCKPDFVYRSSAMEILDADGWRCVNIHGGF